MLGYIPFLFAPLTLQSPCSLFVVGRRKAQKIVEGRPALLEVL